MIREIIELFKITGYMLIFAIMSFIFGFEEAGKIILIACVVIIAIYIGYKIVCLIMNEHEERKRHELFINRKKHFINILSDYLPVLYKKKKTAIQRDDYGLLDIKWWSKEKKEFLTKLKTRHNLYLSDEIYTDLIDYEVDNYTAPKIEKTNIYDEVPTDPYEYELYCATLLNDCGWSTKITKGSGDHGVDIIAEMDGRYVAIQCKLYESSVGNGAVQEVVSGMKFWDCDIGVVVTNSNYTKHAVEIARVHNIHLIHHDELSDLEFLILSPPFYVD